MATKGRRKRTKLEIARDRAEIERLRLRYRMKPLQIAEKINEFYTEEDEDTRPSVGFEQVKKELLAAKEDYQEQESDIITEKRREIIRQFYDLATQCQERYDASIVPEEVATKESRSNSEKGDSTLERTQTKQLLGNPRYLDIKAVCLKFIAELEAVIPPRKMALTNPEGDKAFVFEGNEEQKRLAALAVEAGLVLPPARMEGVTNG